MHPQNLENVVWLVLAAAGGIAQMVRKGMAAAKKAGGTPKPDSVQDERTRRVREEVARKIAQRQTTPPRPSWGLPKAQPPPPLAERKSPRIPARRVWDDIPPLQDPSLKPDVAEMLRPAPAPMAAVFPGSREAAAYTVAVPAVTPILGEPVTSRRLDLFDELRRPATIRRAVLLREIIGPPVALR